MTSVPTFLDFFAGSGLVSEGIKPWLKTIWSNDICQKKALVYAANHSDHPMVVKDICELSASSIPEADVSWASFPCVDLSLAGNLAGITGKRSGLVWKWLELMENMFSPPPVLVIENVAGLISASDSVHYRQLHMALSRMGYNVGPLLKNADKWVPQSRLRVFIIAVKQGVPIDDFVQNSPSWAFPNALLESGRGLENLVFWKVPVPLDSLPKLVDVLDLNAPCDNDFKRNRNIEMIPKVHLERLLRDPADISAAPGYKRTRAGKQVLELRFDGIAGCLRTPKGGSSRQYVVIKAGTELRTRLLTVREVARLMGAPETFKIPGTYNDAYAAMGDAVALPVVSFLAQHLIYPLANRCKHYRGDLEIHVQKVTQSSFAPA